MQYQEEVPWADGVGELRIPLRPGEGEPTSAGRLEVTVTLEDGTFLDPPSSALPLAVAGKTARFSASDVPLAKDVVVRIRPASSAPLAFSAFRSPDGRLPDGLALAPWERLSDVPPEKDGFFLLEHRPAARAAAPGAATAPARKPLSVALLFDTSLSTRWGSLETGWAFVNRLLARLGPADRLVAVPFDRAPAPDPAGLLPATDATKSAALTCHPLPAPRTGNRNGRRGPRRRGAPSERPLCPARPRHRRSRSARRPREGRAGAAALHRPDRRGEARGLPRRLPPGPPPSARQRVAAPRRRSALSRAAPRRPPARGGEGARDGRPPLRGEGRRPEAARRLRRPDAASSRRLPLRLGRPLRTAGEDDDRAGVRDGPGRLPREGPRRARPAPPLGAGPGRRPPPQDRARRREARVGRGDPRALASLQVRHALHRLPRGPPLAAPAAPDPAGRPDPEDRGAPGDRRRRRPPPLRPEARPDPPPGLEPVGGAIPRSRRAPPTDR